MNECKSSFLIFFLIVLLFSCGDVAPLAFAPEDFLGKWNAIKDEFTNKRDAFEKVDILTSTDTDSITLTFSENQLTHEIIFSDGGFAFSVYTYEVMGDTLKVNTFDGEMFYRFIYEQAIIDNAAVNILRLTNEDTAYDFDNDGTPEEATEVIQLERL